MINLQPAHPNPNHVAIALKQAITLNQIQYRLPNAPQPALKNLSLTIPAKGSMGLVDATGSGKTHHGGLNPRPARSAIRPGSAMTRPQILSKLNILGFKCRPIFTGNFERNKVMKYFDADIVGDLNNVKWLFVGNHHHPIVDAIAALPTI